LVPELKQQDLQSIMAWSIEDAIANYETSKSEIEDAAANFDTKIGDGDIRSLKYLIDVFRYCVNVATVKQVLCIASFFFSVLACQTVFAAQVQRRFSLKSAGIPIFSLSQPAPFEPSSSALSKS
jgi:replication-associated recombination protein RarA